MSYPQNHNRSWSRYTALLTSALLLAATATPAQAQLGKLKKMGADAIKDAAKDKATGKKDSVVAPATAAKGSSASTARKNNFTISEERLTLVLATLEPQVVAAERRMVALNASKAHEAKKKQSEACMQALGKSYNPMAAAAVYEKNEARITATQKLSEAVASRLADAISKDDRRAMAFLQDSSLTLQMRSAVYTMGGACVVDFTPPAIIQAQLDEVAAQQAASGSEVGESGVLFDPGAAAKSAMTRWEYGMVRERIALWALLKENPALEKGKEGVFTPEEEAVLSAHAASLKKMAPLFKSEALRWSTWSDLKSW